MIFIRYCALYGMYEKSQTESSTEVRSDAARKRSLLIYTVIFLLLTIMIAPAWMMGVINLPLLGFTAIDSCVLILILRKVIHQRTKMMAHRSSLQLGSWFNRKNIDFEYILSIKFQVHEYHLRIYHIVDQVMSGINWLLQRDQTKYYVLTYEVETERELLQGKIPRVDNTKVRQLIEDIADLTSMRPRYRGIDSDDIAGTIYYFSFTELHSELDPDVSQRLV